MKSQSYEKKVKRDSQGTKGINPDISRREIPFTITNQGYKGLDRGVTRDMSQGAHMSPRKGNYKARAPIRENQGKGFYTASTVWDAREKVIWQMIAQIRHMEAIQR